MALMTQHYFAPSHDLVLTVTIDTLQGGFQAIKAACTSSPAAPYRLDMPTGMASALPTQIRLQHTFSNGVHIAGSLSSESSSSGDGFDIRARLRYGAGAEANYSHVRDEVILHFAPAAARTAGAPDGPQARPLDDHDAPDNDDAAPAGAPSDSPPSQAPAAPASRQEPLFPYVYLRQWPQADSVAARLAYATFPASAAAAPLYVALTAAAPSTREHMQAQALLFRSNATPYAGLYVADCTHLVGLVHFLPKVAQAARQTSDPAALTAASLAIFNLQQPSEMLACLQSPDYRGALERVWQSYFAELILLGEADNTALLSDYTRLLLTDHLLQVLFTPGPPLSAAALTLTCHASLALPAAVFPLPAAAAVAAVPLRACAIGDLQLVQRTLSRYEAGELAHVENIMPRERREIRRLRAQGEHSYDHEERGEQTVLEQHLDDGRNSLVTQARQTIAERTVVNRYADFDTSYGPPTKATLNGSWTEWTKQGSNPGGDEQTAFARDILQESVARVARNVQQARARGSYTRSEHSVTSTIDNSSGDAALLGAFRWLNKVYTASVISRGQRLMVEFLLQDPAATVRARSGYADGAAAIPVAPAKRGVHSFADITPENYGALAAAYEVGEVPPAPAQEKILSAILCNGEQKVMPIPTGYRVARVFLNYVAPQASADGPVILVGREKFRPGDDPAQARTFGEDDTLALCVLASAKAPPVPDAAPAAAPAPANADDPVLPPVQPPEQVPGALTEVLANVVVHCEPSPAMLDAWRIATYHAIVRAHRRQLEQAQEQVRGSPPNARAHIRRQLRQGCTGMLLTHAATLAGPADQAGLPDRVTMADPWMLQFLDELFEWRQMSVQLLAGPPDAPDLSLDAQDDLAYAEFLEADLARVLLPVAVTREAVLLYFLGSGQRWQGAPELAPVDHADLALMLELKRLRAAHTQQATGTSWEIVVPTTMQVQDAHFSVSPSQAGGAP